MMHNCTTGFSVNCSGFSIVDFEQVTAGLDNVLTHSVTILPLLSVLKKSGK